LESIAANQPRFVTNLVRHGQPPAPFSIEDYDAVVRLWLRTEGVGLNESDSRSAIAAYLRRNPRLSFIAEKDGRIIGAVLCGHDGRRGYLHHLAVAKRHRRRGIGRQLVSACLARLRALGILKCNIFVFANNAEGMKFWKRTGWNVRSDLRMMQTRLDDGRGISRNCSC
jgi:N-acetylglutamate synthase